MRIWKKRVVGKVGLPEKVPQSPKSPCFTKTIYKE